MGAPSDINKGGVPMSLLDILIVLLLLSWLGGFSLRVGGGLVHALLVAALVVLIIRLLQGRAV